MPENNLGRGPAGARMRAWAGGGELKFAAAEHWLLYQTRSAIVGHDINIAIVRMHSQMECAVDPKHVLDRHMNSWLLL
jgi:hypothetical protein